MNKKGLNKWYKFVGLLLIVSLIYIVFNKFALKYLEDFIPKNYSDTIEKVLIFAVIIILNSFFVGLTSKLLREHWLTRGDKRDVKLLLSVYKYFEWFFVLFITLSILFKQIGSLITSVGLIGFGVTFALQKPLLNFVGWLTIVFSKTYKIGDIVTINNHNGKVYDVKVMYTNLSELNQVGDPTGKSISMPNEFVLTSAVVNFTKGTSYVWDEIFVHITYQSNWKKASKIAEKIIQDYYNKNIKENLKKAFNSEFKEQESIISRVGFNEKGVILKFRYLVDFNVSNKTKGEITKLLLEKLRSKDIILGKIEDINAEGYKFFG